MASIWLAVVITNAANNSSGVALRPLNAITNKMIVSASFNFEPWLKLRATRSFLLAPAYRNANTLNTIVGRMLITAPAVADIAEGVPPTAPAIIVTTMAAII